MAKSRTADPWRDTEVIDARAPRFNQAVVGTVALAGVVLGWPLLWALIGAQLLIGLTLGRRFCLTCLAYFTLIQPRFGEGELEDSRPARLANTMGFAFLATAALLWWLGSPTAGTVLGAVVAFLALLAATSGFCAGCEIYRLSARLRGSRQSTTAILSPRTSASSTGIVAPSSSSPIPFAPSAASGSSVSPASPIRSSGSMFASAPTSRASTASRSCPPFSRWRLTAGCWSDWRLEL